MRSVVGVVRIELWFVIIQSPCNVTWKVSVWIDRDIEGYVPYITIHHSSVPSYASPLFDRCNSITSHSARCLLRYHNLKAVMGPVFRSGDHCAFFILDLILSNSLRQVKGWYRWLPQEDDFLISSLFFIFSLVTSHRFLWSSLATWIAIPLFIPLLQVYRILFLFYRSIESLSLSTSLYGSSRVKNASSDRSWSPSFLPFPLYTGLYGQEWRSPHHIFIPSYSPTVFPLLRHRIKETSYFPFMGERLCRWSARLSCLNSFSVIPHPSYLFLLTYLFSSYLSYLPSYLETEPFTVWFCALEFLQFPQFLQNLETVHLFSKGGQ